MKVVGDAAVKEETKPATTQAEVSKDSSDKKEEKGMFDEVTKTSEMPVDGDAKETLADARLPGVITNGAADRVKINTDTYSKAELEITPAEKTAFIDALITGERYRQTYSLFGGKVRVVVRSRTADETHAMYAYIRHTIANGGEDSVGVVEGDMAYIPLVAQIEELNGTKYPEMKAPLMYMDTDGKENPPGWYDDFKAWKARPEGLTSALISCIQLFEYKYWTMTREAANKNFWNSDTSIAG